MAALLFSTVLAAQDYEETVRQLLETISANNDSTKINALNRLANLKIEAGNEQAVSYAQEAILISKEQDYDLGIAEGYLVVGKYHLFQGNGEFAKGALKLSLDKIDTAKQRILASDLFFCLGEAHNLDSDFNKRLHYHELALQFRKGIKDDNRLAASLNAFGNIYRTEGNDSVAREFFVRAKDLRESIGDLPGVAACWNNLAILAGNTGDFDQAITLTKHAMEINRSIGRKKNLATNYGNIGLYFLDAGELDSAWVYCMEAYKIREQEGILNHFAGSCNDLGKITLAMGKYEEALIYFNRCAETAIQINGIPWLLDAYRDLARTYELMGDSANHDWYNKLYHQISDSLEQARQKHGSEMAEQFLISEKKEDNPWHSVLLIIAGLMTMALIIWFIVKR